jgi:nitrate/nitrite transporter NarK
MPDIALGLRANWRQFWLLMLVNAFVGAMVGLERTVLPLLAEAEFHLASKGAALSFIAGFGLVKAITNFYAGRLSDRYGRKRVLLAGWLVGLPVPFLVVWAPSWSWIVAANVLLGLNQGLAWSTTVIMKIDLVGPRQRGLAMGLNESAWVPGVLPQDWFSRCCSYARRGTTSRSRRALILGGWTRRLGGRSSRPASCWCAAAGATPPSRRRAMREW